ncbi:hypothetical protein TCAL_15220 [Tigriopus californicus]|uniref:RNA-directed DNA polymerase n=1 Tax=Tigriopus californicus TaxID=6832 RepID=A0A553NEE0_TIGCA|nr:hypothetical protein TCAL_15220 [Tigriopus californicus]
MPVIRLQEVKDPNQASVTNQGGMHINADANQWSTEQDGQSKMWNEFQSNVQSQMQTLRAESQVSLAKAQADQAAQLEEIKNMLFAMQDIQLAAESDDEYQELVRAIMEGFPKDCVSLTPYRKEETHLSCDDGIALHGCHGSRIVVPKSLRKEILRRLHSSHQGVTSTLRRSRQLVFWPGITSDIKSTAEACQQCQIHRPSLCKEPMMAKKETHFFSNVGCPEQLESDGGPQFTARETNSFLRRWGVEQRVSTPHFPQSPNGLAESAVKSVKTLMIKSGGKPSEMFAEGLLELRNTPKNAGLSPAEVLFGQALRTRIPAHKSLFSREWNERFQRFDESRLKEQQIRASETFNKGAQEHVPIQVGAQVRIQTPSTKKWDKLGRIVFRGRYRDYQIRTPSGKVLWRNRRYLYPVPEDNNKKIATDQANCETNEPRRSKRVRFEPDRLQA